MADPRIGSILEDRYRIIDRLGAGGMGVVYRGERLKLGKSVAIKFLHAWSAANEQVLKRFELEAKAMALLQHPNCLSIIDFGVDQHEPYVVMDLATGESLRSLLDKGRPPIARTMEIIRQVLAGLAHAHKQGITHRDIKPDNVMVDSSPDFGDQVRILDFGLAKMREASTELTAGFVVGTPDYMAPEQSFAEPVDAYTDVYSVGVVLFEMLAGQKPFRGETAAEVIRKHRDAPPPRFAEIAPQARISAELEAVVMRALAKAPRDRYRTAAELAVALDATPEALDSRTMAASDARKRAQSDDAQRLGSAATALIGSDALMPVDTVPGSMATAALAPSQIIEGPAQPAQPPVPAPLTPLPAAPYPGSGDAANTYAGPGHMAHAASTGYGSQPGQPPGSGLHAYAPQPGQPGGGHSSVSPQPGYYPPSSQHPALSAQYPGTGQFPASSQHPVLGPAPGQPDHAPPQPKQWGRGVFAVIALGVIGMVAVVAIVSSGGSSEGKQAMGSTTSQAGDQTTTPVPPVPGKTEPTPGQEEPVKLPVADTPEARIEDKPEPEIEPEATDGPAAGDGPEAAPGATDEPEVAAPKVTTNKSDPPELVKVKEKLQAGRTRGLTKELEKLKRKYKSNAEIPFILGQLYFGKLWASDGIKAFRETIARDPSYRENATLIKSAIIGLANDSNHYSVRRFLVHDIGKPAIPYLQDAAKNHRGRSIRERASRALAELQ